MATEQDVSAAAREARRELRRVRSGMPSFVELAVFLILWATSVGLAILVGQANAGLGGATGVAGTIVAALIAAAIKVAHQ